MQRDDSKILFTRYWWKHLYRQRQRSRSDRKRSNLRREMRKIASNLREMMMEAR